MNAAQTQSDLKDDLKCVIWDLYKDVNGIRPRGIDFDAMSYDEMELMYKNLLVDLDRVEEANKISEKAAVVEFEALVGRTMAMGAGSRETALEWIMDGSDCNGDWDYLAYCHDLPYQYFK